MADIDAGMTERDLFDPSGSDVGIESECEPIDERVVTVTSTTGKAAAEDVRVCFGVRPEEVAIGVPLLQPDGSSYAFQKALAAFDGTGSQELLSTLFSGLARKRKQEAAAEARPAEARPAPPLTLKPFQKSLVDKVTGPPSDGRKILWPWEPAGGTGKSKVMSPYLQEQHDALLLDPTAKKCGLDAIAAHYNDSERFRENPILIINLARPESSAAGQSKLYALLERCQDNFTTTKGKQHSWSGVYPHIIVTANVQPAVDKLVGRLEVHFINRDDELVPDTIYQAEVDEYARRRGEEHIAYGESLKAGKETARYLGVKNGDSFHVQRVDTLKGLFKYCTPAGERLYRRDIYAHIAEHASVLWEKTGTAEQRRDAVADPKTLKSGSSVAKAIVDPWNLAFKATFEKELFSHQEGSKNLSMPNGFYTVHLQIEADSSFRARMDSLYET